MSDVAALIQGVEQADSPAKLVVAVQALAASRASAAIPTLIAALGYNNPEAAMAAVSGLVQLGSTAVPQLLQRIDDYNYGARAYTFRTLAAIADPQALETLLNAALADFAPSVRRAAAKGLGNLRWSQLPAEEQLTAKTRALDALITISQDAEWAIRYAAIVGLQALANSCEEPDLVTQIRERLAQLSQSDADSVVRARVLMAQQQLVANC